MRAQVYICEIALQTVNVNREHSHRARSIALPAAPLLAPTREGHLESEVRGVEGAHVPGSPDLRSFLPFFSLRITSLPPPLSFLSAK